MHESNINESKSPALIRPLTHTQKLNQIYTRPAPVRIFPLPNFIPHNPLSLVHLVYAWLCQVIRPSSSLISPLYEGWFSLETRSVQVTDDRATRGLWEQGFFGKGSLSRSEPNWLDGEMSRKGNKMATTSEEYTKKRRAERQRVKWERARKERQAIDQKLLEEAEVVSIENCQSDSVPLPAITTSTLDQLPVPLKLHPVPPTGPLELLSLPNSQSDLKRMQELALSADKIKFSSGDANEWPRETPSLSNSVPYEVVAQSVSSMSVACSKIDECSISKNVVGRNLGIQSHSHEDFVLVSDNKGNSEGSKATSCFGNSDGLEQILVKAVEPKSYSLEPDEKTSESSKERRSSMRSLSSDERNDSKQPELSSAEAMARSTPQVDPPEVDPPVIRDEEHLQLTLEEAFFLCYAFGCLQVIDPVTKTPISSQSLFQICRQNSYFPPRSSSDLSPDDPFMVNYTVYHHFRSLGWVVRSGIKFSVDYMLYNRGPVFSHAEFAVLILPSYSDPYWNSTASLTEYSSRKQNRNWAWMSCINRVISQVKKTLILCYVDIPRPLSKDKEEGLGLDAILSRYKVREFVMSRFLVNRMRA